MPRLQLATPDAKLLPRNGRRQSRSRPHTHAVMPFRTTRPPLGRSSSQRFQPTSQRFQPSLLAYSDSPMRSQNGFTLATDDASDGDDDPNALFSDENVRESGYGSDSEQLQFRESTSRKPFERRSRRASSLGDLVSPSKFTGNISADNVGGKPDDASRNEGAAIGNNNNPHPSRRTSWTRTLAGSARRFSLASTLAGARQALQARERSVVASFHKMHTAAATDEQPGDTHDAMPSASSADSCNDTPDALGNQADNNDTIHLQHQDNGSIDAAGEGTYGAEVELNGEVNDDEDDSTDDNHASENEQSLDAFGRSNSTSLHDDEPGPAEPDDSEQPTPLQQPAAPTKKAARVLRSMRVTSYQTKISKLLPKFFDRRKSAVQATSQAVMQAAMQAASTDQHDDNNNDDGDSSVTKKNDNAMPQMNDDVPRAPECVAAVSEIDVEPTGDTATSTTKSSSRKFSISRPKGLSLWTRRGSKRDNQCDDDAGMQPLFPTAAASFTQPTVDTRIYVAVIAEIVTPKGASLIA